MAATEQLKLDEDRPEKTSLMQMQGDAAAVKVASIGLCLCITLCANVFLMSAIINNLALEMNVIYLLLQAKRIRQIKRLCLLIRKLKVIGLNLKLIFSLN